MKIEWLFADVTAVGSIDRAERAILGVFMTGPVFGQSSADPPPRPTPTLGLSIKIITDVFPPIHSAMCDPKRSISPVDFHHHQRPSRSSWQFAAICGNLRQFAAIRGDSRQRNQFNGGWLLPQKNYYRKVRATSLLSQMFFSLTGCQKVTYKELRSNPGARIQLATRAPPPGPSLLYAPQLPHP